MIRRALLFAALLAPWAGAYTVKPGDTLYSIAQAHKTTVAELQRFNNITDINTIRVGQVIEIPNGQQPVPRQVISSAGFRFSLPLSAYPGDAVTVRVSGTVAQPMITWGGEELFVVQDGDDWVGVGREALGAAPKTVTVKVEAGGESASGDLRLLADPRLEHVMNLVMSDAVLAAQTDENLQRESDVLQAAYALRTPRAWTKPFALPLAAPTASGFGSSRRYERGGRVSQHHGEDLIAQAGRPIYATNDGTVVISGVLYARSGNLVGINHGAGIVSLYFHLSKFGVKVGQKVKRGEVIGWVGTTGLSTGPHLHWEMRVRGEATDPLKWVNKVWP